MIQSTGKEKKKQVQPKKERERILKKKIKKKILLKKDGKGLPDTQTIGVKAAQTNKLARQTDYVWVRTRHTTKPVIALIE